MEVYDADVTIVTPRSYLVMIEDTATFPLSVDLPGTSLAYALMRKSGKTARDTRLQNQTDLTATVSNIATISTTAAENVEEAAKDVVEDRLVWLSRSKGSPTTALNNNDNTVQEAAEGLPIVEPSVLTAASMDTNENDQISAHELSAAVAGVNLHSKRSILH